ncbi:MAG: NAD(P)H-dependent glycerol-3-phosphate dehydrogenase [Sphingomonadales bacterium]
MKKIAVAGAGAWGTALATVAARAGHDVVIWAREGDVVEAINARHENPVFLAGIDLDSRIRATGDLVDISDADAVLLVAPAQHLRTVTEQLRDHLAAGAPAVICSKGIEQKSLMLMTEVVAETLPDAPIAVLSGPTFAAEVARGLPTAVTLACADARIGAALIEALGQPTFRPYLAPDLVGAEIGGAIKNVLAIACGIISGRNLGENARAALVSRGLAEMLRLGRAKGASSETLMGLCGLGDLILTCSSEQSRNMSLGAALGRGQRLDDILGARHTVAEGVFSASAVAELAEKTGIEMPICQGVNRILNHGAGIDAVIEELLSRPFNVEPTGAPLPV